VKPYYLHPWRPRAGHGPLPHDAGRRAGTERALRGRVSGLCQPTYMLDIPGGYGKVPVGPLYVTHQDGACLVRISAGRATPTRAERGPAIRLSDG